jgi:hypothetical protein
MSNSDTQNPWVVRSLPADYPGYLVFVVDAQSDQGNEHSLLVVGFSP